MNATLAHYGLPDLDGVAAALRWAADAIEVGDIPADDLFLVLAGHFAQTTQATATRLMEVKRQPVMDLLPTHAMAKALGTTPGNLKHHTGPIKRFLKARGLRSHPNSPDRKLGEGRPGRHADGFTSQEIQVVVQQVKDIGTLTKAFPPQ